MLSWMTVPRSATAPFPMAAASQPSACWSATYLTGVAGGAAGSGGATPRTALSMEASTSYCLLPYAVLKFFSGKAVVTSSDFSALFAIAPLRIMSRSACSVISPVHASLALRAAIHAASSSGVCASSAG